MVISTNGYIARLNGEEDFVSSDNWEEFVADIKEFRNIVVGRKTYETVTKLYTDYNFDNVDADYKILITHDRNYSPPPGFLVFHSPKEAADFLKAKKMEVMYVEGGELNASFAEAGLMDELLVVIEPFVIGEGRQGLAKGNYELKLVLIEEKRLSKDRVRLLYKVRKTGASYEG